MRGISSYDSSSISTLFSSLGTSKLSGSNFLGIDLGEYASIKSGSYGRLMKSYYKMNSNDTKISSKDQAHSSASASQDAAKTLANIEGEAQELTSVAKELYSTKSDSVFSKKSDGNYDREKIYDKINQFAQEYNSLLTASAKSTSSRIEDAVDSLKYITTGEGKNLEDIGITVDSKTGLLSVNKTTLKAADMDKVKDLFHGTGSYAYSVATRSALIDSYAQAEAARTSTYSKTGAYAYSYNSGSLFYDSF